MLTMTVEDREAFLCETRVGILSNPEPGCRLRVRASQAPS
jgi:hypothetical protein